MKHIELTNHIKGSYLKAQYLEAFLVQSAYIEGLIKLLVDYSFWDNIAKHIKDDTNPQFLIEVNKKVEILGLNDSIKFLLNTKIISKTLSSSLHKYRLKRNQVLHDLVKEMRKDEFERELKLACDLGNEIIETKEFGETSKLLEGIEKIRENTTSDNSKE